MPNNSIYESKAEIKPAQDYVTLWDESKEEDCYFDMIKGPNDKPAFILAAGNASFPVKDPISGKTSMLEHNKARTAVGIDDKQFATASTTTVKIWNFDGLSLARQYNIFNMDNRYFCTLSSGATRSIELLPNQRCLVGFTSSDSEYKNSCLWVMNVDNGETLRFDLSKIVTDIVYKIAAIPNSNNKFVVYDNVCGQEMFIFGVDLKNKQLHLIAQHKNLNIGSFYHIEISPNGKYWAIDMRYYGNPIFGVQVYRVNDNYSMECIARIYKADKPNWNNNNSLFYVYNDKVCEFQPENMSHQVLVKADKNTYFHGLNTFSLGNNTFQVIDKIQNTVKTYELNSGNFTTSIHNVTKLPKELTQHIIRAYVVADKKSVTPLSDFKDTLFKQPAADGYGALEPMDASKNRINISPAPSNMIPGFTLSYPYK